MKENKILSQESLMKQAYDNFDIENIGLSPDQYKIMAMKIPIAQTTQLLDADWRRRAYYQNIIASANGITGSGKSGFLSACGLKLGKIYKEVHNYHYEPFKVENVYYEPEEMQMRIPTLKEGEVLLKDEHLHGQAGMMSDLTTAVLTDAEQQLRKNKNSFLFASIEEEDHAHFFVFEMKHIVPDPVTGYPCFTVAMLKTPLYTDPSVFVWRGLVAMPFPNKVYWDAYEKRKDEHILKLKNQYGDTLNPVRIDSIKIFKKKHDELIRTTREGLVKPIKDSLLMDLVTREIGTRKYTNKVYDYLIDFIKQQVEVEYAKSNEEKMRENENKKEKSQLDKRELLLLQIEEAKRIKEAKLEVFKEKLAEDKRRNDLKQEALAIRKQELLRADEIKKSKLKATEEKVENKKNKLLKQENPAHHFAEDLA